MKLTITLQNCERLSGRPFALRGISGKVYGQAQLDRSAGGHVIDLDYEEFLAINKDIALAGHLPLSKWRVSKIKVEGDEHNEALLGEALEKATAEMAAQKADYEKKLAEISAQRDAAIRAIASGKAPEPIAEPVAPAAAEPPAFIDALNTIDTAAAVIPALGLEKSEAPEIGVPAETIHTRESLLAIKKFRDLRKICVEAGVPNAEKISDREEIVAAYFGHVAGKISAESANAPQTPTSEEAKQADPAE